MWLRPTGGLPASSSTATTDARGWLRKRWKEHSASSPREGAERSTDTPSHFHEGNHTRVHSSGAEPSQCTTASASVPSVLSAQAIALRSCEKVFVVDDVIPQVALRHLRPSSGFPDFSAVFIAMFCL